MDLLGSCLGFTSKSYLHLHGPANSVVYPSPPDELFVDASDVIKIVNLITTSLQLAEPTLCPDLK